MAAEVVASIVDTLLEGGGQKAEDDISAQASNIQATEEPRIKPTLSQTHSYSTDEEPHSITDAVTRQPM